MLQVRPPIVTILGHVDHGKTTLLDTIRHTSVAAREHGGITQRIGAYQVEVEGGGSTGKITFIDTPGHAAFIQMRARGAQVTDIAVLVVAAGDGVMPQTKESISHIQTAKIPFIIAINKIDLPDADPEKVKSQLAEEGVSVEGYGGNTVAVEISAKTGLGIKHLLEMISLIAQMQNLQADPDGDFEGVVIESLLDNRKGVTATVLVKNGTLSVGDQIVCEDSSGKVRGMFDESGRPVVSALPSTPVEVLGLNTIPPVGARVVKTNPRGKVSAKSEEGKSPVAVKSPQPEAEFKIIIKADVSGSLEAILGLIAGKNLQIIASGLGDVTDSDVLLAKTSHCSIYCFNVRLPKEVAKLAEEEKISLKTFRIIYEFVDDLQKTMEIFYNPDLGETILGKAVVVAQFKIEGVRIAGSRMTEGKLARTDSLHLVRDGKTIADTKTKSLRVKKDEVDEVKQGQEFGIAFQPYVDFKIGDVITSFRN